VTPPHSCPNCGKERSLEALGYYWRWITTPACGEEVRIAVRRFLCRICLVTVSCLPKFAQPYRLVCNSTIQAFFGGDDSERSDVERWRDLLRRYRRRYEESFQHLRGTCAGLFGQCPSYEQASRFWQRVTESCGGVAEATGMLVERLGVTLFGRYRCHQRPMGVVSLNPQSAKSREPPVTPTQPVCGQLRWRAGKLRSQCELIKNRFPSNNHQSRAMPGPGWNSG